MQRLIRSDRRSGELPSAVLPLNNKIKRPLQLPIQPLHIRHLIRLRQPSNRPLNRHPLLSRNLLRVLANPRLSILQQRLRQRLGTRIPIPDAQLVVPRGGRAAVVLANLAGDDAVALAELDGPVELRGGVALEEGGLGEGEGEALVEALLVEEVGVFEGGLGAG